MGPQIFSREHGRAGGRGSREKIWGPMGPHGLLEEPHGRQTSKKPRIACPALGPSYFLEFRGAAHGPWGPGGGPGVPWGALRGQLFCYGGLVLIFLDYGLDHRSHVDFVAFFIVKLLAQGFPSLEATI